MSQLPIIIQGGMGVAISNWELAKTVSQLGQLGVISGTGASRLLISRLMDGDLDGAVRRALSHFPVPEIAQEIVERYYIPGGKTPEQSYKNPPAYTITPTRFLDALTAVANFMEVFLAKEGHQGLIGINLLEKIQLPNLASLYGAALAGVDVVLMGAGIPIQIAGALDKLARHEAATYRIDVQGAESTDDIRIEFDPKRVFPGLAEKLGPIKRPLFFPIISSVTLAQALLKRSEGPINGFVVEGPTAGGHNAPPRGTLKLTEEGEPIYGEKDQVDLEKLKQFGLPFWLAGGYGNPQQVQAALDAGASGVQVGTAFALCNESGMKLSIRQQLIDQALDGKLRVFTSVRASPTGFPFKVALIDKTMTDQETYAERPRLCDLSFLRSPYKRPDGQIGYRCPSEPVEDYVRKGGQVEATEGRVCLCNALAATAGFPQMRKDGYLERPIVTAGDDMVNVRQFLKPGEKTYSAQDVITYLLNGVEVRQTAIQHAVG